MKDHPSHPGAPKNNRHLYFSLLALVFLAWTHRFLLDDAFISFRYAEHVTQGKGWVWQEGERLEGYTNFLWTAILTVPHFFHINPVPFAHSLGLILFACSLHVTYRLALLTLGTHESALLCMLLLGTHTTYSCFATSGLETMMQSCLFVSSFYLSMKSAMEKSLPVRRVLGLSLLMGLAVLTRLDSLILCLVVGSIFLGTLVQVQLSLAQRCSRLVCLILPVLLLAGVWLLWKWHYYGDLLPNSFYAKVSSKRWLSGQRGLYYLYLFFLSYWLFPFPILALATRPRWPSYRITWLTFSIALVGLWCCYVIYVGGDYMEFRFLVPVLPFLFLLIVWIVQERIRDTAIRMALICLVLAGSIHHALSFGISTNNVSAASIDRLEGHLMDPQWDWIGIGKRFWRSFQGDPGLLIATTPAGAIPYFSKLKTVDMLGINDRWVAFHGENLFVRPGHQKITSIQYLVDRQVHLVLDYPWLRPDSASDHQGVYLLKELNERWFIHLRSLRELPDHVKVLEIPMDSGYVLVALYLTPSPLVDRVVHEEGWISFPLKEEIPLGNFELERE